MAELDRFGAVNYPFTASADRRPAREAPSIQQVQSVLRRFRRFRGTATMKRLVPDAGSPASPRGGGRFKRS